jgi:hypothetical protein
LSQLLSGFFQLSQLLSTVRYSCEGLDAQATELGTQLWAHGLLSTSHHFSPWQLWPFLVRSFRLF